MSSLLRFMRRGLDATGPRLDKPAKRCRHCPPLCICQGSPMPHDRRPGLIDTEGPSVRLWVSDTVAVLHDGRWTLGYCCAELGHRFTVDTPTEAACRLRYNHPEEQQ